MFGLDPEAIEKAVKAVEGFGDDVRVMRGDLLRIAVAQERVAEATCAILATLEAIHVQTMTR